MIERISQGSIQGAMIEWDANFRTRMSEAQIDALAESWSRSLEKYRVTEDEWFELSQAVLEECRYFPKLQEVLEMRRTSSTSSTALPAAGGERQEDLYNELPLVPTDRNPEDLLTEEEYRLVRYHSELWGAGGPDRVDKKMSKRDIEIVGQALTRLAEFGFAVSRINGNMLVFATVLGGIKIRDECRGKTWADIRERFRDVSRIPGRKR